MRQNNKEFYFVQRMIDITVQHKLEIKYYFQNNIEEKIKKQKNVLNYYLMSPSKTYIKIKLFW